MSPESAIGMVAGVVSILAAVVAVTRHITKLHYGIGQEKLEGQKELAEKRYEDLDARYKDLLDLVAASRRTGTEALAKKADIDEELTSVMAKMRATASSIYVPLLDSAARRPSGLVFLSIQPFNRKASSLKRKTIPMKSLAGQCFEGGQAVVRPNAKTDPSHFDRADQVSGYQTQDILSFPLRHSDQIVGVLQLLSKEGPEPFDEADVAAVEVLASALGTKVAGFIANPSNFEILGVAKETSSREAACMVCDLTRSAHLFTELGRPSAIQHLNEYLERSCDIAIQHGATVDKYVGDGVILRFNVPREVDDYRWAAVSAALEIRSAFIDMKSNWITMGESLSDVFLRIAIASGEVTEAVIGHPQMQQLTLMGPPMSVSANLCDVATRDRDVIVLDDNTHDPVSMRVIARPIQDPSRLGKASAFISSAYELEGVR